MKKIIYIFVVYLASFSSILYAHEAWLMTPAQFKDWSVKPIPLLFTDFNLINSSLGILTLITIGVWYLLGKSHLVNSFLKFQKYFEHNYDLGLLLLRLCMAITLIIAAFGLIPRQGFEDSHVSTLFVSDLQLPSHLLWIKWIELAIAICLILGIYIRLMGLLILTCLVIAFYQFGGVVIYYSGYIGGIAAYFLLMGGGKFAIIKNVILKSPARLALIILRVCTGLNFIYGGIYYKFLHPNIDIGMLTIHHTFTVGLGAEIFTLMMALIETALGILLISGVLIRPLSIIILGFIVSMGILVQENILAHTFIIGISCVLFINGAGNNTKLKKLP